MFIFYLYLYVNNIMNIKKLLIESIKESLNEGASDILYHFTSDYNLLNILKTNKFELTLALGRDSDLNLNKGKFYYLSTTRSKSTGYKMGTARIKLNGRKLNANNKVLPVDYWQYSKNPNDWDSKQSYRQALLSAEQEDRLISDKPFIDEASKFIISVDVVFDEKIISDIIYYTEKYDIPLFVYKNKEDFLLGKSPINHYAYRDKNYEENSDKSNNYEPLYTLYDIASLIAFNDDENYNKIINILNNQEEINKFNDRLKNNTYNYFKLSSYDYGAKRVIKNWFHNIRGKREYQNIFNILTSDMRKKGVSTLEDYLKVKQWKGLKTDDDYKKELYEYVNNIIDKSFAKSFDSLYGYIEIDDKYYSDIKDSPEVANYLNTQVKKIKSIVKEIIFDDEKEILKYTFYLSRDEIEKYFNFDSLKISDKLNITYIKNDDITYYDEVIKNMFYYHILSDIDEAAYEKIKSINVDKQKRYQ
jgi:hypothetical protein